MKAKQIILAALACLTLAGCEPAVHDDGTANVWTRSYTLITNYQAKLYGKVANDGGNYVTERGFVVSTIDITPTIGYSHTTKVVCGSGVGDFNETVRRNVSTSTIYFRAYAINSAGTSYGTTINIPAN